MSYQSKYQFQTKELSWKICGIADHRLPYIESLLGVSLVPRGTFLLLKASNQKKISIALSFFDALQQYCLSHLEILSDWERLYKEIEESLHLPKTSVAKEKENIVFTTLSGRSIQANGARQRVYVDSLTKNLITIGIGPAGTGKTFLSIAVACNFLVSGKRSRIIITRPAVEAGESLGFLPGALEQKIDPYLRPLYDALYECLQRDQVNDMIASRQIEIAPLAYMRGRTLNDAMIILDESQNCTMTQLKMFLTRLGRNSSMCLSGDVTQIDLPMHKSGLAQTANLLQKIEGIGVTYFQPEDIVRSPIVEKILDAFESQRENL